MNSKKIKEFIELAKKSGVTELKYESEGEKYFVSFQVANSPQVLSNAPVLKSDRLQGEQTLKEKKDPSLKEITSPFVGTFYRSASPDADPYAKLGDKVSNGTVLCIVEAMKIMNEIESDVSGEIVEICVENETFVEFGQVLFRVRP